MNNLSRNLVDEDSVGFAIQVDITTEEAADELVALKTGQIAVDDVISVPIATFVFVLAALLITIVAHTDVEFVKQLLHGCNVLFG